jgi:hypothetical protein
MFQYQPELVAQLHYQHGLGKITEFLKYNSRGLYAADSVEHMEIGRLHNILKNVAY